MEFRKIKGYENYSVNELGGVRNDVKGNFLKPIKSQNGYYFVSLHGAHKNIHRLVGENFIINPENKNEVNHINGIKSDNIIENLEWCTHKENMQHSFMTGLNTKAGIIKAYKKTRKLNIDDIEKIKELTKNGFSQRKIGSIFNVTHQTIGNLISKKTYQNL
jgi:hypothetical protein